MEINNPISFEILSQLVSEWKNFQEYLNKESNVVTFRYEDLLYEPYNFYKEILKSSGYHVSSADIKRAVYLNPPQGSVLKHLGKFTSKDLTYIEQELEELMSQFGYVI